MSLQKIKQWLENPDRKFEQGLILYDQYKTDSKKDAFYRTAPTFAKGCLQYNMLLGDLTRIARILEQKEASNPSAKEITPALPPITLTRDTTPTIIKKAKAIKINGDFPTVNVDDLPEELKAKYEENQALTKSLAKNYANLDVEGLTNDERKVIAQAICDEFDKRKENWIEIDVWVKNNNSGSNDDQEKDPNTLTVEELKKAIKIKKDSINRALKTKTEKNSKKVEKNVKEWEGEIDKLQSILDTKK